MTQASVADNTGSKECKHSNITIVIHPQGPGPIVSFTGSLLIYFMNKLNVCHHNAQTLNLNFSHDGCAAVNTSSESISDKSPSDSTGAAPHLSDALVPQDDSATESESESDREYLSNLLSKRRSRMATTQLLPAKLTPQKIQNKIPRNILPKPIKTESSPNIMRDCLRSVSHYFL